MSERDKKSQWSDEKDRDEQSWKSEAKIGNDDLWVEGMENEYPWWFFLLCTPLFTSNSQHCQVRGWIDLAWAWDRHGLWTRLLLLPLFVVRALNFSLLHVEDSQPGWHVFVYTFYLAVSSTMGTSFRFVFPSPSFSLPLFDIIEETVLHECFFTRNYLLCSTIFSFLAHRPSHVPICFCYWQRGRFNGINPWRNLRTNLKRMSDTNSKYRFIECVWKLSHTKNHSLTV